MNRVFSSVVVFVGSFVLLVGQLNAQSCTPQSQMQPQERDALATAARDLALKIQANDRAGLQKQTIPEFSANFEGIANAVATVSPKLSGTVAEVEQLYVLDASKITKRPDGSFNDAEFVCTLKTGGKQPTEADFTIPGLPPGRYAFALVDFTGAVPWQIPMLLRKDDPATPWKLAGLFPKETTAAGHDGLWYWKQGRSIAKTQPWAAYLYYAEARQLLQPAAFVSSTHLEKLRTEAMDAAPPEIVNGVSNDEPLVIKGADGAEYRFTGFAPDNGLRSNQLDIALHMNEAPGVTDPAAMQARNRAAMTAFLSVHPEMRDNFHGLWVFTDRPNQFPVVTSAAMKEIQ